MANKYFDGGKNNTLELLGCRECAQVYETTNYDMFHVLNGNREIDKKNVSKIIKSISEYGYIMIPITVNQSFEVIEGQHRLAALKELGLPIRFVIDNVADIKTCIALNKNRKGWTSRNYIDCYADLGKDSYIKLVSLIDKYGNGKTSNIKYTLHKIPETAVRLIAINSSFLDGASNSMFINGKFEMNNFDEVDFRCSEFSRLWDAINLRDAYCGRAEFWVGAYIILKNIFDNVSIDFLIRKISDNYTMVGCPGSRITALEIMQNIYNYNTPKSKKRFFADAYKQMN